MFFQIFRPNLCKRGRCPVGQNVSPRTKTRPWRRTWPRWRRSSRPCSRAASCEGPKKAHRNLVGLRRTASRSPRPVLSARASSRSFITAIGVGRRDFTVWTGRQRALVAPGLPCPAPYAGCYSSLPKRIGRTEVRSPRPFRALVALAGRNLPPLCSPPRRRAGLSAMAQIERAYANWSRPIYSPLEHMGGVRCLLTPQPLLP